MSNSDPEAEAPAQPTAAELLRERIGRLLAGLGGLDQLAFWRVARAPESYRVVLALAMALVSILAAGIALRTSLLGSEAARLDSVALQETVEQQRREQFAALVIDQDSRLFATYSQIYAGLAEERLAIKGEPNLDTIASLYLKIQADGELLQAIRPMFQAAAPTFVDGELHFDGPARLEAWLATDARLQELRSGITAERADELHEAALLLVGDVAVLVATLLLLTIAQVTPREIATPAAALAFVLLASALLVIGLTESIDSVRNAVLGIAAVCVPLGILTVIAVLRGAAGRNAPGSPDSGRHRATSHISAAADTLQRTRALTEHLPSPEPGLSDPSELETPFGRRVALLIGMATLLAAVTGFRQASAFHETELASERARDHVIDATSLTQRRIGEAEAVIDQLARYVMARVNASSASHEAEFFENGHRDAAAAASKREASRWTTLADADAASAAMLASVMGPEGYGVDSGADPRFPNRYLIEAQREALVEIGLSDADNRSSAAWAAQGSVHTGLLAVLAVTLYLLGLSLILHTETVRKAFPIVAAACMLGVVFVGLTQFRDQPSAPELTAERDRSAAEHYAAGEVALNLAAFDPRAQEPLAEARREFEAAIALRPEFALARQDLSSVLIRAGSPETTGYPSIIDADACHAANEQLDEARRLQIESAIAVWSLAYCHYREGLLKNDRSLLEQAEHELTAAIAGLPAQGILYDNLGITRLALGDVEGARSAYANGIAPTRFRDLDAQTPLEPYSRETIVAAALTELETIAAKRPETRETAGELKQFIVSSTMLNPPSAPVDISNFELRIIGSTLHWSANLTGVQEDRASVSVQLYRFDADRQEWYVIPELSGDASNQAGTSFFIGRMSDTDPTRYGGDLSLLWLQPPQCAGGHQFRVEVYTGSGVASASIEVPDLGLVPDYDRLMHVAFCRPPDWSLTSSATGDYQVFRSEDGARGLTVLRFHMPGMTQSLLYLQVQVLTLIHADLFPGVATPLPQAAFNGEWYRSHPRSGLAGIEGYMSIDDGKTLVNVTALIDDFGSIAVAASYGPPEDFATAGEGALAVMDSLVFFR